jgi:hypothetical protein
MKDYLVLLPHFKGGKFVMMKKLGFIIVMTMLSLTTLSSIGAQEAKAEIFGKISYYVPTKAGADGKWMTENDCALDEMYKYTPKGTKVHVKNMDNGKSKVLEKWDWGKFAQYGVIVDVLPNTFTYLGGVKSQGYIKNGMATFPY